MTRNTRVKDGQMHMLVLEERGKVVVALRKSCWSSMVCRGAREDQQRKDSTPLMASWTWTDSDELRPLAFRFTSTAVPAWWMLSCVALWKEIWCRIREGVN